MLDEEVVGFQSLQPQLVEELLLLDVLVDESTKESVKSMKIVGRHFEALEAPRFRHGGQVIKGHLEQSRQKPDLKLNCDKSLTRVQQRIRSGLSFG